MMSKEGRTRIVYDGKRMRKAITRKVIDYSSTMIKMLQNNHLERDWRDRVALQNQEDYLFEYLPPSCYPHNPTNAVATKYLHTSTNKVRCPVNVVRVINCAKSKWTPEGRRLVTGASSGEFTLWNGTAFNFETILQAHDTAVRSMAWSHNGNFMVSGDHGGVIKFWQPSMNNLKLFQGHKEPVRDLTFSPTDAKFASCSDDGTIKIWDFKEAQEERCLTGHGWDVKNIHWHPYKSLIASGSKDNLVKLWDPKSAANLATIHSHKNTIMDLKWNNNGNWLLSAGKDMVVKNYDIRMMKECQTFKGHRKEVTSMAWHPQHENLFCTGSADGQIFFWDVNDENPIGTIDAAHEGTVWSLDWHPVGHILCSGSNDHSTRFWTRMRPGDVSADRITPSGDDQQEKEDEDEVTPIPGMGMGDKRRDQAPLPHIVKQASAANRNDHVNRNERSTQDTRYNRPQQNLRPQQQPSGQNRSSNEAQDTRNNRPQQQQSNQNNQTRPTNEAQDSRYNRPQQQQSNQVNQNRPSNEGPRRPNPYSSYSSSHPKQR